MIQHREAFPQIGTLVPSIPQHQGRYALKINGGEELGPDLSSGLRVALLLGDTWIPGTIEHTSGLYVIQSSTAIEGGYYFQADGGGRCGLCCGMKVRILSWGM